MTAKKRSSKENKEEQLLEKIDKLESEIIKLRVKNNFLTKKLKILTSKNFSKKEETIDDPELLILTEIVSEKVNISTSTLRLNEQIADKISSYRHIISHLGKKHTLNTYKDIGLFLGGRDHSTIMHGYVTYLDLRDTDEIYRKLTDRIESEFIERLDKHRQPPVKTEQTVESTTVNDSTN